MGNRLTLEGGQAVAYDYLVIATGPKLSFDEVPGAGPNGGHTHSVCTVGHAESFYKDYQEFLKNPGPVVIGAMPGASCFGPAYEFSLILDTDLRRRKLRHKVPITFVTAEPYIGHLGLGGRLQGDARVRAAQPRHQVDHQRQDHQGRSRQAVHDPLDDQGQVVKEHELGFKLAMMLPAFMGVDPVAAVTDICNPRGFMLVDEHQRSKKYRNIFSAGVCVAIPPVEVTPVPSGAPKTGYMIENMVTALAHNIADELAGRPATAKATWNAICLADMGDTGAAFVALPQIPPRNVNWFKKGKWVHLAKIAFEKYFMRKMKVGNSDPIYEKYVLKTLGIVRLVQ